MKRSSTTKAIEADDSSMGLSKELMHRLEVLRTLHGKASVKAMLEEVIETLEHSQGANEAEIFANLPPRLQQVLRLIADGMSTKEIASRLKISKKTVEFHRRRLSKELGIQSVAKLARFAVRAGAVTL